MVQRLLALAAIAALAAGCDTRVGGLVGVTPPASRIAFISQPSSSAVGVNIAPAVQVAIQNDDGTTITSANAQVNLTIVTGTGAAGAVLTGGGPLAATGGIVNFTNLRIDLAGTGYQLLATATGFASVASTQFNITP